MEPILIVSADGHVSAPVDVYERFLDERYHSLVWSLARENEDYVEKFGQFGRPSDEELEAYDRRGALAAGAEFGSWDAERRMRELDAEGITAELLLATTPFSTTPFFHTANRPWPSEVRLAGARAWNRFVADMTAAAPGRLLGVLEPGPCHDMATTVEELEWAAEHGFVSVTAPGSPSDDSLPLLAAEHFEPFWAACAALPLVLSVHAGWGLPQGHLHTTYEQDMGALQGMSLMDVQKKLARLDLGPRSVFWKLMLGGVFDRHAGLKLALTEIRADWLPATLDHLDERLSPSNSPITMRPSEYFERHCVMVPSSIHRAEVKMRHRIGVERLIFGADYPHFEGTWPNTREWISDAFVGVPEDEVRAIVGLNAIETFGLDARLLRSVARRIGPAPDDLLSGSRADDQLIAHFDKRSAYLRPAEEIDRQELDDWIARDLAVFGTQHR